MCICVHGQKYDGAAQLVLTVHSLRIHWLMVVLCLIPMLGSIPPSSQCTPPQSAGEPGRSADVPTATAVSSPTHTTH